MGNATFGTQIRRVRQNAGLTMEEFAGKFRGDQKQCKHVGKQRCCST